MTSDSRQTGLGRVHLGRQCALLLAIILSLCAGLAPVEQAGAYEQWRWYSQDEGCSPGNHIDPVGIVFLGKHADPPYVDQEVQDRMYATYGGNWHHGEAGQHLWAKNGGPDNGFCEEMTESVASSPGVPHSRWHMRIGEVHDQFLGESDGDPFDPDPPTIEAGDPGPYMYWSLGTPHYDKWFYDYNGVLRPPDAGHCNPGNKSSILKGGSFNGARRKFKQGIRDGGPKGFIRIRGTSEGNSKKRTNGCDGEIVSSNGLVVWAKFGAIAKDSINSTGPYTP